MELATQRLGSNKNSSLSAFFIDCKFQCFIVEDEFRSKKVWGETRIPAGRYKVELRTEGEFHNRYTAKFGRDWHKGMIWITGVPGFEYILMHIGNNEADTAGCLCVGNTANNPNVGNVFVGDSTGAYKAFYPIVRDALIKGEEVWMNVLDEGQMNLAA